MFIKLSLVLFYNTFPIYLTKKPYYKIIKNEKYFKICTITITTKKYYSFLFFSFVYSI